jgi:hypothetical protein
LKKKKIKEEEEGATLIVDGKRKEVPTLGFLFFCVFSANS